MEIKNKKKVLCWMLDGIGGKIPTEMQRKN
jgi:hypothetical protein